MRFMARDETVKASLEVGEEGQKVIPFRRKEPVYSLEWI
jgi:hypothetical protein